jgi:hypothetical protein
MEELGFKLGFHNGGGVLPGADFAVIFFISVDFPSVLMAVQTN